MKKALSIGAIIALSIINSGSFTHEVRAQNTANVQNAATQTAGVQANSVTPVNEQISIAVIKDDNKNVEARIADLTTAGAEIGIHQMVITGTKEETTLPDGTTEMQIIWDRAYRITEEGDRKDTVITIPLDSEISIPTGVDLKSGDQFNAEGSPIELLAAWERLQTEEEQDEEEEVAEDVASDNDAGGALSNNAEQDEIDFQSPEFEAVPDTVIEVTSDGCSVRVDLEQLVAIVQERTLEDGTEIQPCQDTLTRYPLERAYSGCSLEFDTANNQAFEQFKLNYTDPVAGQIQVQDCTADEDSIIALTETAEGCGIFHDFAQDTSFQQTRITYFYQGANQTLQDCQNSETEFAHERTQQSCSPIITETTVTQQDRIRINVNGTSQFISDCEPDTSTTQEIQSEACLAPRYTHDFNSGQSFLNKSFFYLENGQQVFVSTCQQSTLAFAHQLDETECTPQHDDVNRETTLFARTFIEETAGNQTFISGCEPVSPTIPYVENGDQWAISSSTLSSLNLTGNDNSSAVIEANSVAGDNFLRSNGWEAIPGNPVRCTTDTIANYNSPICLRFSNISGRRMQFESPRYCVINEIKNAWQTQAGITISRENSTTEPTWTTTLNGNSCSSVSNVNFPITARQVTPTSAGDCTISLSCTQPQCLLTHLRAHPTYERGDGTAFTDAQVTTDNIYVCGDGSNLDGQAVN